MGISMASWRKDLDSEEWGLRPHAALSSYGAWRAPHFSTLPFLKVENGGLLLCLSHGVCVKSKGNHKCENAV